MTIRVLRYQLPPGVNWYRHIISRSTRGNIIIRWFDWNIWIVANLPQTLYSKKLKRKETNMAGTSKGARKFAQKKLRDDPDYFKNLSRKSKKPRGGKASPGSFKKGNEFAAKGGKAGRRGPSKTHHLSHETLEDFPLEFEELK